MRDIEGHGVIAAAMGWIGTVGTIGAYVMLSRGRWHSASLRYAALNGIGGLLAAGASAAYGAWPSVASNLLWSAWPCTPPSSPSASAGPSGQSS